MRRAAIAAALVLLADLAAAQDARPESSPAYSVGAAHAMLMDAAPCFPRVDGGAAAVEALLQASLAIVGQRPDYQQAYDRAMMLTRQQQRHIPRSDPVACAQIRAALQYFLAMQ